MANKQVISHYIQHFDQYMIPKSKLVNANILSGLVRFGSGRNILV